MVYWSSCIQGCRLPFKVLILFVRQIDSRMSPFTVRLLACWAACGVALTSAFWFRAGPVCDLMWADPDPFKSGFSTSSRGASYVFGKDITERFMHVNHLDFIFRAHQLCQEGYQVLWGKLATVWSAPNYCYRMGNKAAVCQVSEHLDRFFLVFEAAPEHCRDSHAHARGSPFASKALAGIHQENPGKVQSGQGQRQSVLRPFFKETDEEYSSESEPEDG